MSAVDHIGIAFDSLAGGWPSTRRWASKSGRRDGRVEKVRVAFLPVSGPGSSCSNHRPDSPDRLLPSRNGARVSIICLRVDDIHCRDGRPQAKDSAPVGRAPARSARQPGLLSFTEVCRGVCSSSSCSREGRPMDLGEIVVVSCSGPGESLGCAPRADRRRRNRPGRPLTPATDWLRARQRRTSDVGP